MMPSSLPFFAFQPFNFQLHNSPVCISFYTHHSLWVFDTLLFSILIHTSGYLTPANNMRSTTLLVSLVALTTSAFAASSDKCQAQNIVDACVSGYKDRISNCEKASNDWICMCDVYKDVLTCYNNCPDSNAKPPVQNQVTQYCAAAEP
jgi:hypothetical protein